MTLWLHDDLQGALDYHHQTKNDWKEGMFVEVFGGIKIHAKDNRRTIVANRVNMVTDFNLVTHHFLQCIHVHLFALKGGNLGHHLQQVTGGIKKLFDPYSFGANAGGAVKADPVADNPYNSTLDGSANAGASSSLQQLVIDTCKNVPPHGISDLDIVKRLSQFPADEVTKTLKYLLDIGSIYTARENHYKA